MTCEVTNLSTAANCHKCKRRIEQHVHYCDQRLWCGHCCPEHKPAEPLPDREVGTLAGTQREMFGE